MTDDARVKEALDDLVRTVGRLIGEVAGPNSDPTGRLDGLWDRVRAFIQRLAKRLEPSAGIVKQILDLLAATRALLIIVGAVA